jgi:hypothetical protein
MSATEPDGRQAELTSTQGSLEYKSVRHRKTISCRPHAKVVRTFSGVVAHVEAVHVTTRAHARRLHCRCGAKRSFHNVCSWRWRDDRSPNEMLRTRVTIPVSDHAAAVTHAPKLPRDRLCGYVTFCADSSS